MKKLFIFAALAAPLFLFSCAKEIEKVAENSPEASKGFAFKASIENLDSPTKADINSDNDLVWASGDKIGVYVDDSTWGSGETYYYRQNPFTLVGAGGTTEGDFRWDYDDGNFVSTLATVAYFPWQGRNAAGTCNNVYEGYIYYKLPNYYNDYTSGMMLTPLAATITRSGVPEAYENITFKHAGAAVKVTINNLPAGAHSMGMTATKSDDSAQQIYGNYKLDVSNIGTAAMVVDGSAVPANNSVWLNIEPTATERPFTFLFPVPALEASSKLTFDIYDENDIKVWTAGAKTKGDVALGRKDVLVMPALDITPYSDFDAVSSKWTVIGTVNGTNWDADIPMVTNGSICIAKGVSLEANSELKVRADGAWTTSYGYSVLNSSKSDNAVDSGEPNYNIKVTTAGLYDIIFNSDDSAYGEYAAHEIRVVESVCPYPSAPIVFAMDGDMSEWASVPGTVRTPSSGNAIEQVKAYADKDYVYVYVKRAKLGRYDQLWGNDCYYYYGFDLDNDPATGANEKNSAKWEAWCYLNIFGASEGDFNTSPSGGTAGMTISDVTCNGVVSGSIEVEARFPRANFPDFTPGTIGVTVWGSKDAGPASTTFTMDLVIPEPATSVTLDGDMSDWADGEAISNSGSIKEWKYSSDASNLYFYFKVAKSDIKDDAGSYNWKRYIYIALDTDNSTSTGSTYSGAGLSFPGCDALATLYPFRGTVPDGMTYPAGVEFVNGVDNQGDTQSPVGTSTGSHVTAYGYISGDYAYLEIGVPRAAIGTPAKGKMKVQFSYSWNLTGAQLIEIKQ